MKILVIRVYLHLQTPLEAILSLNSWTKADKAAEILTLFFPSVIWFDQTSHEFSTQDLLVDALFAELKQLSEDVANASAHV